MEKLDEVLNLLRQALPLLQEFGEWKSQEAEREKLAAQEKSESEKEFKAWLAQRQKEQAQEQADAERLQEHFFGGSEWAKERLTPKRF